MTDTDRAKSAKERLAAAKKAAEDAEVVETAETAAEKVAEQAAEQMAATAADDAKPAEAAKGAEADAPETETDESSAGEPQAGADDADAAAPEEPAENPADDPAREESAEETAPHEEKAEQPAPQAAAAPAKRSLAAVALQWLVIFIAGAVVAVFAAPRLAPYLPAGIAEIVAPRDAGLDEALAAANAANTEALAALTARLDAAESALADQTAAAEAARATLASTLEARVAAAEAAKADTSVFEAAVDALAGRVTQAEAALAGVRKEVSGLSELGGEYAAPSAETLERVAAFGAAVQGLRAEVAALSDATSNVDGMAAKADLAALAARVDALEGGQAATAGAEAEASRIRGSAQLDAALTRIGEALAAGAPFAEPLSAAETLAGADAPAPLKAVADGGATTVTALRRSFQDAAQAAYAAALEADASGGFADRMLARVQGRIGGRPSVETEGPDAGAVLSRIEARLSDGAPDIALTEANALPEAAKAAMAGWIADLEETVAARAAFAEYRAALATN